MRSELLGIASSLTSAALVAAIGILALTPSSVLAGTCNNAGTSCTGFVERIYYNGAGDLFIRLEGVNIPEQTTCTGSQNYGLVTADNPRLNQFYAMVLTAFSLDNELALRMKTNSENCEIAYMFMDAPTN